MKKLVAIAVGTLLVAGTMPGFAETIQKRENREEKRIDNGVNNGSLTPKEQQRLDDQQRIIEQERENAAADGKITKRERKDIKHDQKRLSHDIHAKKHNKRRVYQ